MILSIEAKKAFDKIQHLFLIKTLQSVVAEGTFLSILKAIYEKPLANIILKGEALGAFQEQDRDVHSLTTAIQHSTGSPSFSNQRTKRNKRYPNCQGSQTFTLYR